MTSITQYNETLPPVEQQDPAIAAKTVRIHSLILDGGASTVDGSRQKYSAVCLWYFCRGWDDAGCGKAVFDIKVAAEILGKSVPSIKRYLVDGVKKGFFREVKRCNGIITVYYSSVHNVALAYDLPQLGAFADIMLTDLKSWRFWGTQLAMQSLQDSSRWLAKLGSDDPKRTKVAQVEDLLDPNHESSSSSKGGTSAKVKQQIIHQSNQYTFVQRNFTMFGVSQQHIASKLGRHKSTVQRKLDNMHRRERGVDPLGKTQLAQFVQKCSFFEFNQLRQLDVDLNGLFYSAGALFQVGCNIYQRQFQTTSGKACKYWFGRLRDKVKGSAHLDVDAQYQN